MKIIKWLRNRVRRRPAPAPRTTVSRAVSREEVLWCYRHILRREPESEAAIASHLTNDFQGLVAGFVGSPEFLNRPSVTVSREEVVWCYRNILGREPESAAVIDAHLATDFKTLVADFLGSPEFSEMRVQPAASLADKVSFQRLDAPPILVETQATDQQMIAATAKVKATWSHLGSLQPHFSVRTEEQFLPENLAGSLADFWRSGETEAALVQRILERHHFAACADKTCVEYGCGVGRMTMGFAHRFARVHGYDISDAHLEHARRRAHEINAANIIFHSCADNFPVHLEACDFFYSHLVLQHNPPPLIAALLRQALCALLPGGLAIFQVPTYGIDYRFRINEWLAASPSADMEMHCLPQQQVFELIALERCVLLEVWEDNSTGAPTRFVSNTFVVRKVG